MLDLIRLDRRVQAVDKETFITLIRQQEGYMYKLAKYMLVREQDIEEAIKETILKSYRTIGRIRDTICQEDWLLDILINNCKEIINNNKKLKELGFIIEDNVKFCSYEEAELKEMLLNSREEIIIPENIGNMVEKALCSVGEKMTEVTKLKLNLWSKLLNISNTKLVLLGALMIIFAGLYYQDHTTFLGTTEKVFSVKETDSITSSYPEIKKFDRFETFLANVDNNKVDTVELVRFTEEGDPITYNLRYDGIKIYCTINRTKKN